MLPTRTIIRAGRTIRVNNNVVRRQVRFATQDATKNAPGTSGAVTGGLVGGTAALAVTYAWYHFSGAKSAVQTAKQAKGYLDSATDQLKVKFQDKTPDDASEAIKTLRDAANRYASFVPGGKGYVDSAFNDLEAIRKQHGQEADGIVREAYGELRDVSKKGMNLEAANEAYNVLSKHLQRLLELGSDAIDDIMQNHPQLKEKLGGSTEQLKQLGQQLGPEAKKEVDETWQQVNDLLKTGLSVDTISKARSLIQEKIEKVQKLGERAFDKGYEQVKPMLDKSPQVKQFVEQNMETLKKGRVTDTIDKIRSAINNGSTEDLEKYTQQVKDKAQQFSSASSTQLSSWLSMIPGGSQIIPQLQKLQHIAEKHGSEAQNLAKETIDEIKQVLDKKSDRVEKLYEQGKQEAKDQ